MLRVDSMVSFFRPSRVQDLGHGVGKLDSLSPGQDNMRRGVAAELNGVNDVAPFS